MHGAGNGVFGTGGIKFGDAPLSIRGGADPFNGPTAACAMRIQQLSVEEAFASLRSGPDGLAADEAESRLREFGPNEVQQVAREPLLMVFLKEFVHFFALVLWIAAALAFVAEAYEPGQGMASLGWAIVGVIVVNGLFSFWQAYRAERAMLALQKLLPQIVKVVRDGTVRRVPPANLVPGDVILIEAGDRVPADCRVVEASSLRVNTATVTGESVPHSRTADPSDHHADPLGHDALLGARNVLLAGTNVVAGEGRALVFATGRHTAFGEIARLTQTAEEGLSPLQQEIVRLSRLVASLALGLGIVFFLVGQAVGLPFWANLMFGVGIIVANVPEGLLPTVTLALAMGSQRMARRNALIRHLPAVETLGATDVICTDKTGTLTTNEMTVSRVYLSGQWLDVGNSDLLSQSACLHPRFFDVARLCHSLTETRDEGRPGVAGDPMEIALAAFAQTVVKDAAAAERVSEIPFDSQRKRLTTVHRIGGELRLLCKGAPEVVVALCSDVETDGGLASLNSAERGRILAAAEQMGRQGLRVLALAQRTPPSSDVAANEQGLTFAGLAAFEDPPRPEVAAAIQRCHEAGIKVIMVTGDHPETAMAIGRQIGLLFSEKPRVIIGNHLARLSDTQLQLALDAPEILFARVAADQKMRIVQSLKRKGKVVAVTGDGVNDAPALKAADIGIAMGCSGTDVAREAADMVLLDDDFATIVAAIEEGRAIFSNIRKFLTYILTSNVPEIVPYLAFVLLRIPLPLTIIQILAVDLGTDMLPALGLGSEPPHPDSMKRPPRARHERLLTWRVMARAYLWLGPMQAVAAMAAFYFILHAGGWQYGTLLSPDNLLYRQATSACLTAIILMQVVNVFLCRSEIRSVIAFPLGSNRLILAGVVVELLLILAIDYTAWGQALLGTAAIPARAWLFVLPFALAMLLLEETRKRFVVKRMRRAQLHN